MLCLKAREPFPEPGVTSLQRGKNELQSISSFGEVFRSLDVRSKYSEAFIHYSSKGELVPDDITIELWAAQINTMVQSLRYKPDIDFLMLDGIPRNAAQAQILSSKIEVRGVFNLEIKDRSKLFERLQRRALKENRIDDMNEQIIENRLRVYDEETKPVIDFYGPSLINNINADQWPYQVLRDILNKIEHYRSTPN
jgi:adenylate kinase